MCTIIIAYKEFGEAKIVVAENRDEFYGRDYSFPKKVYPESPHDSKDFWFKAPIDLKKGGTWIGYNSSGLFVTLSNLKNNYNEGKNLRSRGLLTKDVLNETDINKARSKIKNSVKQNEYNGFNMVLASKERALGVTYNESLEYTEFDKGIHVITNSRIVKPDEKALKVSKSLPNKNISLNIWIEKIKKLLTNHKIGICKHGEKFGTTSSSIISLNPNNKDKTKYLFAEGPPCEVNYKSV